MIRADLSGLRDEYLTDAPVRLYMLDDVGGAWQPNTAATGSTSVAPDLGSDGADAHYYFPCQVGGVRYCVPCVWLPEQPISREYLGVQAATGITVSSWAGLTLSVLMRTDTPAQGSQYLWCQELVGARLSLYYGPTGGTNEYGIHLQIGTDTIKAVLQPRRGWSLISARIDGSGEGYLYQDGEELTLEATSPTFAFPAGAADSQFALGKVPNGGGTQFNGHLAAFALFDSDVGAARIADYWDAVRSEMTRCQSGEVWAFPPNWRVPVLERLSWASPTLGAWDDREQRYALQAGPRREMEYLYTAPDDARRRRLERTLRYGQGRTYELPLWWDAVRLPSAVSAGDIVLPLTSALRGERFAVGDWLTIMSSDGEQSETAIVIDADSSQIELLGGLVYSWPAGTAVYPSAEARLGSAESALIRITDTITEQALQLRYVEEVAITAATEATTYQSHPVYIPDHNWREARASGIDWSGEIIDYGGMAEASARSDLPRGSVSVQATLTTRSAVADHVAWLQTRQGRLKACWAPSLAPDLTLTDDTGTGSAVLTVLADGLADLPITEDRRDLCITMHDGTRVYRRITAVAASGDDELLTCDSAFSGGLLASDVRSVSWLRLMRLDADQVEISHVTTENAESAFRLATVVADAASAAPAYSGGYHGAEDPPTAPVLPPMETCADDLVITCMGELDLSGPGSDLVTLDTGQTLVWTINYDAALRAKGTFSVATHNPAPPLTCTREVSISEEPGDFTTPLISGAAYEVATASFVDSRHGVSPLLKANLVDGGRYFVNVRLSGAGCGEYQFAVSYWG